VNRSAIPPPVTRVLDAAQAWLPRGMAEVERRLAELIAGHGEALGRQAAATLSAGGKRLRPMLVLLSAGSANDDSVRAATAVELVHMASLVHDDVLDAAPLRRGSPTVFARAGRPVATAVGDLLLSRAFAELADHTDAARRRVALLADASVALAQGELAQRRDAYDTAITAERYMERCRLKTARLFECACLMGLAARGRAGGEGAESAPGEAELRAFGGEIGLAFQLLDDVLDVTGPPERTGKARGTDLLDGTVTLPLILAIRDEPALAEVELRGIDAAAAEALCDRIAATRALEEVRSRALAMVAEAKRRLRGPAFDREQAELLGLVADGVVERYS
jgi:geranylgeranyl pyrophosphate synthase